ncbi:MAG: PDZ domain-containing protein, partial [bacterium]
MKAPLKKWFLTLAITGLVIVACGATAFAQDGSNTFTIKPGDDGDGWLGVTMQDLTRSMARALDLEHGEGVLIQEVVDDSPADEAGLEEGDVILEFDGRPVEDSDDLARYVRRTEPGDNAIIEIFRDGRARTIEVVMGERKENNNVWFYSDDDKDNQMLQHLDLNDLKGNARVLMKRLGDDCENMHIEMFGGDHGYLGVQLTGLTEQLGEYFGVENGEGALISEVKADSPAAAAGLQAGDVVVEIEDDAVAAPGDVTKYMRGTEEGDEIRLRVLRDRSPRTFRITLAELPDQLTWLEEGDKHSRAPQV